MKMGVTGNLERALQAWRDVLGPEHVLAYKDTTSAAETAPFSRRCR